MYVYRKIKRVVVVVVVVREREGSISYLAQTGHTRCIHRECRGDCCCPPARGSPNLKWHCLWSYSGPDRPSHQAAPSLHNTICISKRKERMKMIGLEDKQQTRIERIEDRKKRGDAKKRERRMRKRKRKRKMTRTHPCDGIVV